MDNLDIQLLNVSTVALILVIRFYFYNSNKVGDNELFKSFFGLLSFSHICSISFGKYLKDFYTKDISMTSSTFLFVPRRLLLMYSWYYLLYFGCSFIYGDVFWIRQLNFKKAFLLIMIGGLEAVFAKTKHLAAGNWANADSMPLQPIVNVGLAPVYDFTHTDLLDKF